MRLTYVQVRTCWHNGVHFKVASDQSVLYSLPHCLDIVASHFRRSSVASDSAIAIDRAIGVEIIFNEVKEENVGRPLVK